MTSSYGRVKQTRNAHTRRCDEALRPPRVNAGGHPEGEARRIPPPSAAVLSFRASTKRESKDPEGNGIAAEKVCSRKRELTFRVLMLTFSYFFLSAHFGFHFCRPTFPLRITRLISFDSLRSLRMTETRRLRVNARAIDNLPYRERRRFCSRFFLNKKGGAPEPDAPKGEINRLPANVSNGEASYLIMRCPQRSR